MKYTITFAFLLVMNFTIFSQNNLPHGKRGGVMKIETLQSFQNADVIDNVNNIALNDGSTLHKVNSHTDKNGAQHVRYQQYYKNIEVKNGTILYHVRNGNTYSITGKFQDIQDFDVTPAIPENHIHDIINQYLLSKYHHISLQNIEFNDNQLIIGDAGKNKYLPKLMFVVNAKSHILSGPFNVDIYIDANSGIIIKEINNIHHISVEGHGHGLRYKDISFTTDSIAHDRFLLKDNERSIQAFNETKNNEFFSDSDNIWESQYENYQASLDGYYATIKYYDFLQDKFSRNSIDDEGAALLINLNIHNLVNAFWDGDAVSIGNGSCETHRPLTTFEIVSHEFTHGLTDHTSNLEYNAESGALNESISDIFGKALEYYENRENFDWKVGGDIDRIEDVPVRSLEDPHLVNHPKYYNGINWYTGLADNEGVHINSSVMNHWFYLLVEGGSSTNEVGYQYDIDPIGMDDVLQIVYQMQTSYLTQTSEYYEAYLYSLEAATDLFGSESTVYKNVKKAWKTVGVDETINNVLDIIFDVEVNDMPTNIFFYCYDDFQQFEITISNTTGDSISGISNAWGTITATQNDITQTYQISKADIPDNLDVDENFTIKTNFSFAQEHADIEAIVDLSIVQQSDTLSQKFNYEFNFVGIDDIRVFDSYWNFNPCRTGYGNILSENFSLRLPTCLDGDEYVNFVYQGRDNTETVKFLLSDQESPSFPFFTSVLNVSGKAESLYPLDEVELTIEYVDNNEILEIAYYDYADYFSKSISEPTVIDFSAESEAKRGNLYFVSQCAWCESKVVDEQLTIKRNMPEPHSYDCIPEDEFDLYQISPFSSNYISICVDLENIKDPIFSFKVRQEDKPEETAEYNQRLHYLTLYGSGGGLIDEFIKSTQNEYIEVVIPLEGENTKTDKIEFLILSDGVTTYLDDITIRSGTTSVSNIDSNTFTLSNPNTDFVNIFSNHAFQKSSNASIYSMNGAFAFSVPIQGQNPVVNVSNLTNGIYFMKIEDTKNNITETMKFAIVK